MHGAGDNRPVIRSLLTAAVVLTCARGATAHHSIAGVYDRNAPVTLEATVAEFHLVNPHAYLIVTVERGDRAGTWKLELDNRYELVDAGVKADTIRPGDRIVATGSRARDGSRSIYALRIDRRSDGFWYEQVGNSPKVGRSR